ncbi:MAG: ankyrin repeat domain-containing protein [Rhodocyclaceae bacterium]|nr:ankyrin repeat domain-containing protein [Rhodocyclaceae bacterium]
MPDPAMRPLRPLLVLVLFLPAMATFSADMVSESSFKAVHEAARTGTRADIEHLLKANPAQRDMRSPLGSTPLHLAATNSDTGPLQALLAAGADPNARDGEGATPLHMAAYGTNARAAKLLLEAGADPMAKTNAGRDPTSLARKVRADEVAGVISLWLLKGCKPGRPC